MISVAEPSNEHIVEGYSEKRKFDGVVSRRMTNKEQK